MKKHWITKEEEETISSFLFFFGDPPGTRDLKPCGTYMEHYGLVIRYLYGYLFCCIEFMWCSFVILWCKIAIFAPR